MRSKQVVKMGIEIEGVILLEDAGQVRGNPMGQCTGCPGVDADDPDMRDLMQSAQEAVQHIILQEELVAHVQDLLRRIDLVLEIGELEISLTDVLATLADYFEVPLAEDAAEDSFSFLPALKVESGASVRESIIHHSINGSFAFRKDDFKAIFCPVIDNFLQADKRMVKINGAGNSETGFGFHPDPFICLPDFYFHQQWI